MQSESTAPKKQPRRRLKRTATCDICGTTYHPIRKSQRFCSNPCRMVWWKSEVSSKALESANAKKAELAAQGHVQARKGSHWVSDAPSSKSNKGRKDHDRALLKAAQSEAENNDDEDQEWAERAQYWESQGADDAEGPEAFNAPKAEGKPLVLVGHGVQLRVHNGALVVRPGLTHYPQQVEEQRYFPADRKLPSRIVAVDCDGSITLDVLSWLARHDIPLIQLDYRGKVLSIASRSMQPYDTALREAQLAAATNGVGLKIATELIRRKIKGGRETLQTFWGTEKRDRGLQKLELALRELEKTPASVDALRIIEARAALAYFLCWEEVAIRWKGIGRKPIPESWHRGGMRQGILADGTNRHATHPLNAMLNYAYAAAESQMRIAAVARGLDPTIGYLHAVSPGRLANIYDLMEPLRAEVDRAVLELVREHTFAPSDFTVGSTGVCRVHPQLARRVAELSHRADEATALAELAVHFLLPRQGRTRSPLQCRQPSRTGTKRGRPSRHLPT